jgi:hypothetical protein
MKRFSIVLAGGLGMLVVGLGVALIGGPAPLTSPQAVVSPTPSSAASASPPASPLPTPVGTAPPTTGPTSQPSLPTTEPTAGATVQPTVQPATQPTATPEPTAAPTTGASVWTRVRLLDDDDFARSLRAALGDPEDDFWPGVPSLALDRGGNAHVTWAAHEFWRPRAIHYATNVGGRWSLTELTGRDSLDADPRIAVDGGGSVAIVFTRDDEDDFVEPTYHLIVKRPGTGWGEPIDIPLPVNASWHRNVAVHDGTVHIAYETFHETDQLATIWHATYAGNTWTADEVAVVPARVTRLALAVTPRGDVGVAFLHGDSSTAAIATRTGPGQSFEVRELPAPPIDLSQANNLIELGADGSLHVISGSRYTSFSGGLWNGARVVFPRVSWIDGCGVRLSRSRPLPAVLRAGPGGVAHVFSHFDGPHNNVAWHAANADRGFVTRKLGGPDETYAANETVRETIDECDEGDVVDGIDIDGLDLAVDARGRPHVVRTDQLVYFVGPAN